MSPKPPTPEPTYTVRIVSKFTADCFIEEKGIDETSRNSLLDLVTNNDGNLTHYAFVLNSNIHFFPIKDVFISFIKEK